uniref:Uncharacterized protein n=1 Tax=Panagrolaimus sp. PS1159 TaxID=55785 RepID=A0AC35FYE1_9BILA
DQVLLMAEQHGLCVQTTRPLTPIAAKFLQQLESLPIDRIRVPTIECFLFKNYMTENLNVWEENIEPNFLKSDVFIPMEWIIYKTRFDLFHANYAAAQFRTSKMLLKLLLDTKPDFPSLLLELRDYVYFDYNKLQHFAANLGITTLESIKVAESVIDVGSATTPESQVKAIAFGAAISREMINDEKAREQLIQALETQMEISNNSAENLRIETALLCIKEINSPLIKKVPKSVDVPSEEFFNQYVLSNPSVFTQYSTIKPDVCERFYELNRIKYPPKFPERYSYPEEFAEFIYRLCPKDLHPLLFLLIGKTMQLQHVSLIKSWERNIDFFLNTVGKSFPPNHSYMKDIQPILVLEALPIKLHAAYTTIGFQDVKIVESLVLKCEGALNNSSNAKSIIKFLKYYLPILLNCGYYENVKRAISYVKDEVFYKFFISFTSLLSFSNENLSMNAKKEFFEQYVTLIKLFTDDGLSRKLLFTSKDFLDMIQNICEPNAIKHLLNYTLQIYNRWFLKSDNSSHILINHPEMFSCFILPDSYKLDPTDTRFDSHWGSNKEIINQIIHICLKVSNRICSNDPFVLRATGDYTFVINNYNSSLRFYLNCILILTNYLSHPFTFNNATHIDDLFWKKVVTCLIQLKRPTEAAITCQLITNMFEILPHIHSVLFSGECEDASSHYFHLIGDIAIFQAMSAAYVRQGLMKLQRRLVESVLSRTFNGNNSSKSLQTHEVLRRKSHWIRVLCSEVFDSFDKL